MSDLQDLIHKTSMDCLAKGRQQEQERIIKLLEEQLTHSFDNEDSPYYIDGLHLAIAVIKGEK